MLSAINNSSPYVYHVAKTGNDANDGNNLVTLAESAKLTVQAAVDTAASGDTIIIWPGDYAESVDCNNSELHFIGTSKYSSKIVPGAGRGVWSMGDGSSLYNLSVEALEQSLTGVAISTTDNLDVTDCILYGAYDAVDSGVGGTSNIKLYRSYLKSKFDGITATLYNFNVTDCVVEVTGEYSDTEGSRCLALNSGSRGVFTNCDFIAQRDDASIKELGIGHFGGVAVDGSIVFNNCSCYVKSSGSHAGSTFGFWYYGFWNNTTVAHNNCTMYIETGASHTSDLFAYKSEENTSGLFQGTITGGSIVIKNGGTPDNGPYDIWADTGNWIHSGVAMSNTFNEDGGTIHPAHVNIMEVNESSDAATSLEEAAAIIANKATQTKATGSIAVRDRADGADLYTITMSDTTSTIVRDLT